MANQNTRTGQESNQQGDRSRQDQGSRRTGDVSRESGRMDESRRRDSEISDAE